MVGGGRAGSAGFQYPTSGKLISDQITSRFGVAWLRQQSRLPANGNRPAAEAAAASTSIKLRGTELQAATVRHAVEKMSPEMRGATSR